MTPANIAGMAMLGGMDVAALTDHNSCGNCPAFFCACEAHGVVPVAGMELTTAEEIHLVCLFPTLETAMAFDAAVRPYRMQRKNRPEIFGNQILMDTRDAAAGEESLLLILATALPLERAVRLVRSYGGAAYPAHIDRESNGILAILGAIPETPAFETLEVADRIGRRRLPNGTADGSSPRATRTISGTLRTRPVPCRFTAAMRSRCAARSFDCSTEGADEGTGAQHPRLPRTRFAPVRRTSRLRLRTPARGEPLRSPTTAAAWTKRSLAA